MSVTAERILGPINLSHYSSALLMNLSSDGGRTLSTKKLSQLKMTHLSQMSITNFADQKAIVAAVKETLAALARPQGGSLVWEGRGEMGDGGDEAQPKNKRTQRKSQDRKSFEKRRSFDFKKQFEKIDGMRGELDKEGKKKKVDGIRRRSFDPDENQKTDSDMMDEVQRNIAEDEHAEARTIAKPRKKMGANTETNFKFTNASAGVEEKAARKARAQQYGNSAQRTAKADDGLHKLGLKAMKKVRGAWGARGQDRPGFKHCALCSNRRFSSLPSPISSRMT